MEHLVFGIVCLVVSSQKYEYLYLYSMDKLWPKQSLLRSVCGKKVLLLEHFFIALFSTFNLLQQKYKDNYYDKTLVVNLSNG